jgi:hypothetical protein
MPMPFTKRKLRNKKCYTVYATKSKRIFAKCTTKKNAEKQLRLLRAITYNKSFKLINKLNPRQSTRKRKPVQRYSP